MKNKTSKITLRHCKVPTDKAKGALSKFFGNWQVCPDCHGAGFFDKQRKSANVPEYTSVYSGDLEGVDDLIEHSENVSNDLKNIIYRELGIRTTCPCCDGAKYVRRPAEKKVNS